MKYRVLLGGRNNTVIDDFFLLLGDAFDSVTTTERYEDILAHLRLCNPNVFVFCMNAEPREIITRMGAAKQQMKKQNIPFVLIGTEEECSDFCAISPRIADLILTKPISAVAIQSAIIKYMEEKEKQEKEEAEIQRQLEEMKKRKELAAMKKHILVVDDDPLMLKLMREYLHEDYEVATAVSGKIALKFLEKKKTDLILLDYEMPVEDGPAVLKKLRQREETKDIPVVFLTGITDSEKIKKVLVMKPQGYLLKPIDSEKLMETIHNVLTPEA